MVGVALGALAPVAAHAAPIAGQYIVVLKESVANPAAVANEHARKYGVEPSHVYRHALKGYAATVPSARLEALRADASVDSVEADELLTTPSPPPPRPLGQPAQVLTLAVDRIDGDLSSTRSGDGRGRVHVNVAVLDTGIDVDHVDLNLGGGVDCARGQGFDDRNGHGTFVGGLLGAKDNSIGIVGVAPGVPLWAVRVLNARGFGPNSWFICGVDWVTSTRRDSDTRNDILVANVSAADPFRGSEGCTKATGARPVRRAVCRSIAAGVTYVVAAGNESTDLATLFPSAYDDVLTMSATAETDGQPGGTGPPFPPECDAPQDFDDTPATFSNFATQPADQAHTLAAPGVCLLSTFPDNQYALWSGTSFSTPLGAGTVALCLASQCSGLAPQQIVQKIVADAAAYNEANPGYGFQGDPLRPIGGKYYGHLIRAGLY
jgi:subtilisin